MAGRPLKRALKRAKSDKAEFAPKTMVQLCRYVEQVDLWDDKKWVTKTGAAMPELARAAARAVLFLIANGTPILIALKQRQLSWAIWNGLCRQYEKLLEDAQAARTMGREAHFEECLEVAHRLAVTGTLEPVVSAGEVVTKVRRYNTTILLRLMAARDPRFSESYRVDQTSGGKPVAPTTNLYALFPTEQDPPLGKPPASASEKGT